MNGLNYHHLIYRNLIKNVFKTSSLFIYKNFTSHILNQDLNKDLNNVSKNKQLFKQFSKDEEEESKNLASYFEMISECKRAAKNTYLFIFKGTIDSKNAISLPDELNSKNYDYFNYNGKNMCLIDLQCDQEKVDSIFQNVDEEKLGDFKFYHVKGPFLSSKLVKNKDEQNGIEFQNYDETQVNFKKLKKISTATEQLDYLIEQTKISELEKRIKFTLINYLERNICRGVFDNFELIPFGSSFTGLGCKHGDLDLLLIPKPISSKRNSNELNKFIAKNKLTYLYKHQPLDDKKSINNCLKIIKQILGLLPGIEVEMHISAAIVPIIKLTSPVVNVSMDISMSLKAQNNGVILMSQTLHLYDKLFPNLKKLYILLRLWGHENNIIQSQPGSHLKNFSFLMLLISFLQTRSKPILPSMQAILVNNEQKIIECQINNENVDLFDLVAEFFCFLSQSNFVRLSIDPYNGKLSRNVSLQPMFIKNPFDPDNPNIVRNMVTKSVIKIKNVASASLDSYKKDDLSSLFNVTHNINVPDFD